MSNDIIIEEFDDRRWERSVVFQEFVRIAEAKDLLHKDVGCESCAAEDDKLSTTENDWEEATQYVIDCEEQEEQEKINYKEDEKKFSELASSLMKKAEALLDEGKAAEALEVERKIWQIKHNLRKMKQIAKSQTEE